MPSHHPHGMMKLAFPGMPAWSILGFHRVQLSGRGAKAQERQGLPRNPWLPHPLNQIPLCPVFLAPALPELLQPRLGALLHSPQSLHLAQQPSQVFRPPATVVTAQRGHLRMKGSSVSLRTRQAAQRPHLGFLVSEGSPSPCAALSPVAALGRARSSGAGTRRGHALA